MFRQSSNRNSLDKGSMVKRVLQIAFLLAAVVWLLNRINKNEYAGDQISIDREHVDFGRKGKAGSENVVVINGRTIDFDDTSETNEAGRQAEAFGQHSEEKNEDESFGKEREESQKSFADADQAETQEEQLGNKDGSDDSSVSNRDVAVGNERSTSELDALRLPSQRHSENSQDPNEGEKLGDDSLRRNELLTLDRSKIDTEEEITFDEERIFSSQNQSEGDGKVDEIEKETIDSDGGVKSETEISSENSFEVEKEATETNGGDKFETDGSNSLKMPRPIQVQVMPASLSLTMRTMRCLSTMSLLVRLHLILKETLALVLRLPNTIPCKMEALIQEQGMKLPIYPIPPKKKYQ
ncbi:unnamed protein product [Musa textilis]